MHGTVTLREAQEAELPRIASFWLAMFEEIGMFAEADFPPDWRERFVRYFGARIASDEARYVVAVDGERIVGTAGALLADGYPVAIHARRFGYIFGVYVERTHRGQGLATELTRAAIAFLQSKHCDRIRLHASEGGHPIYERLGFGPTNEMQLRA